MTGKELYSKALDILERDGQLVFSLVLEKKGSGPRSPGTAAIIDPSGSVTGTVGGGVLEDAVASEATRMLKGEESFNQVRYDLDEMEMYCGGEILLWFHVQDRSEREFYQKAIELLQAETPLAVARVVDSSDGRPFRKLIGNVFLLTPTGDCYFSTGLESLDQWLSQRAGRTFREGTSKLLSVTGSQLDLEPEQGFEVFIEFLSPKPSLIIVGWGHVGKKLSELAKSTGLFRVQIYDPELDESAGADRSNLGSLPALEKDEAANLPSFPLGRSYWVICTSDYENDREALGTILSRDELPAYIGLLGSQSKFEKIKEELVRKGIDMSRLEKVRCPAGLDFGGNSPSEIAVSILAELVKEIGIG